MKITIILPTSYDDNGLLIKKKKATTPNLTIFYLAALVPTGHQVAVIEEIVEDVNFDEPTDLVALSVLTGGCNRAYQIADEYRRRGVAVVMGGIHTSCLPEESAEHADAIVVGEAEDTWPELIEDFQHGTMKKRYDEVKRESLAKLPHPRYDLIKPEKYLRSSPFGSPIISLQTSRGCPHNCDFCSVTRFWGSKMRFRPVEDVIEEIKLSKAKMFFFTDDNFVINSEHTLKLCAAMKPLKISWACQLDSNAYRKPQVVQAMGESGCFLAFVGMESLDPASLSGVNKGFNRPGNYTELFQTFSRQGIGIFASIIFGFDNDSPETVQNTVNFLMANKARMATFFPLSPNPGTVLYNRMREANRLTNERWWYFNSSERIKYEPPRKTGVELAQMAFRSFYSGASIAARFFPPPPKLIVPLMMNVAINRKTKGPFCLKAVI